MNVGDWWRHVVEDMLPWFDAQAERARNRRTEAITKRSQATRVRAEKLITEYREAAKDHDTAAKNHGEAGERLVDEVRDK